MAPLAADANVTGSRARPGRPQGRSGGRRTFVADDPPAGLITIADKPTLPGRRGEMNVQREPAGVSRATLWRRLERARQETPR